MSEGPRKNFSDLLFEKIPPFITFGLIIFPFVGGYVMPDITAYFVIIFNVFFLYKSSSFVIFFALSLLKIRQAEHIDWLKRLEEIEDLDGALAQIDQKLMHLKELGFDKELLPQENKLKAISPYARLVFKYERFKVKRFLQSERNRLRDLKQKGINYDWKALHHIVIIPHWKEPEHVLESTILRIKDSNYPATKITILLGAEKRDPNGKEISESLKQKYEQYFENFWVNSHELLGDEIVGKSSNMASAGKYAKTKVDELGWDYKQITVTSCDADSQIPKNYFANLTYMYVTGKDSIYKFYNAAMVLYANIWRLPFYARVKNSMSTIYNVARLIRTDKLVPFSTYTASFWIIDQIGYWTPYITPEDFHIFFKALFRFPDKVSTLPIYQKIMADAAEGESHLETIKNNYFQERRWSWGISDDGWLLKNLVRKIIHLEANFTIIYRSMHVIFDHIIGPVSSVIILFGGNIPLLVNPQFAATTVGINLPGISSFIIQITLYLLILAIFLDQYLKPAKPGKKNFLRRIFYWLEWLAQPFVGLLLVALPGIEAHTRLLFGKYLEYYLTKKK